jgi:hypothetical protein
MRSLLPPISTSPSPVGSLHRHGASLLPEQAIRERSMTSVRIVGRGEVVETVQWLMEFRHLWHRGVYGLGRGIQGCRWRHWWRIYLGNIKYSWSRLLTAGLQSLSNRFSVWLLIRYCLSRYSYWSLLQPEFQMISHEVLTALSDQAPTL